MMRRWTTLAKSNLVDTFDYLLGFVRRSLGENKMSSERREETVLRQFVFSKKIFFSQPRGRHRVEKAEKNPSLRALCDRQQ